MKGLMSTTVGATDSLEDRLSSNPVIRRTRDYQVEHPEFLRSVINQGLGTDAGHVVMKYSLADATMALQNLVQNEIEREILAEQGARAFVNTHLRDLAEIFCQQIGCEDDPTELAEYIADIDNWTSLWFLNAFGEVAREVAGLSPDEFYRIQGPRLIFTDEHYTQAKRFGDVLTTELLFKKITESSRNLTNISDFKFETVPRETASEIRDRIEFPDHLKGKMSAITRARHPGVLAEMYEVYQEDTELAAEYETLRTEGVFHYSTTALGNNGFVVKDRELSTPGEAIFYTVSPSKMQFLGNLGKFVWSLGTEYGVIEGSQMLAKKVFAPIRSFITGRRDYKQLALTYDSEKREFARKTAERVAQITRLEAAAEIQKAERDAATARADAAERKLELLEDAGLKHDAIAAAREGFAYHQATVFNLICQNLLTAYQAANSGDQNYTGYIDAFDAKLRFRFKGRKGLKKSDLESKLSGRIAETTGRRSISYEDLLTFHQTLVESLKDEISPEVYGQLKPTFDLLPNLNKHRKAFIARVEDFESRGKGPSITELPLEGLLHRVEGIARRKIEGEWSSKVTVSTSYTARVRSPRSFTDNVYDLIKNCVEAGATEVELQANDFSAFKHLDAYNGLLEQEGKFPQAYICIKDNGRGYPHADETNLEINNPNAEVRNRSTRGHQQGGGKGTRNLHELITTDFHRGKLRGLYHVDDTNRSAGTEFYLFFYSDDLTTLRE